MRITTSPHNQARCNWKLRERSTFDYIKWYEIYEHGLGDEENQGDELGHSDSERKNDNHPYMGFPYDILLNMIMDKGGHRQINYDYLLTKVSPNDDVEKERTIMKIVFLYNHH